MVRLPTIVLPVLSTLLFTQGSHGFNYLENARTASDALLSWYDHDTGLFKTTGWWNSAECIHALIDMQTIDPSSPYNDIIQNTFERNKGDWMKTDFYDDEGWWALAWIKAYDMTKNKDYLDAAITLFDDMTKGWGTPCGGIWWDKDHTYVNAIANELFFSVAAHLASRTHDIKYLNWAIQEWQWFEKSTMINSQGTINDGLNGACQNNNYQVWTYNQGVIVDGLLELSVASFDESYISVANTIAWAGIHKLTASNGILHERCEKDCGGDVSQFKGIFIRSLRTLQTMTGDKKLKSFIELNARSVWKRARNSHDQLANVWSGPFDKADASTHSSALEALIAAATLQKH